MLRLVIVIIICKICVNFRQEIHKSVLQKMRQLKFTVKYIQLRLNHQTVNIFIFYSLLQYIIYI